MKINPKEKYGSIFFKGFIAGIGWATGATIGFALFLSLLGFLLSRLGGLPIVGNFFARLIEVTIQALETRKIFP